jgi:transposase
MRRRGRPSLPPGRYFRMLLIGYFEGIDSERGLEWRCSDSLSLREFLRLAEREGVPNSCSPAIELKQRSM